MEYNLKNTILTVLLLASLPAILPAQQERKFIRKGTSLYDNGNFLEAEIEYRKALDKKKDSYEGRFNVAASQYKQEKFKESVSDLQSLANQTDDPVKLHQIYHNLGNSYLGMMQTDQQNASNYLDMSIDAYKKALKNNPSDNETRYNLIAAMKMKQEQQNQEQQQQQNKDQQQDQKEQEQQQQQDQKEQQDQQQDQKEQQEQQNQQQQEDVNRDNAERILQALEQDEKDLQEKMNQKKQVQPVRIEKNW